MMNRYGVTLVLLDAFEADNAYQALKRAREELLHPQAPHALTATLMRTKGFLFEEAVVGGWERFQHENIVKLETGTLKRTLANRGGNRIFTKGRSGPYHASLHGVSAMSNVRIPHNHWRAHVIWVPERESVDE